MHEPLHALTESDELLTRAQVAALLSVSPSTVTRWADEGKLTCVRTLGGHRRYLREEISTILNTVANHSHLKLAALKEESMQELQVEIPRLYGDHHTLAVHQALAQLPGIEEVWASPATHALRIGFDPQQLEVETILKRLAKAGYPARNGERSATDHRKDPGWARLDLRMTKTYANGA